MTATIKNLYQGLDNVGFIGTENITGSLHLNNIFSNVRPGHRFVTNNRRMSVLSEKILKMNGAKAFHQMAFSMAK